MLISKFILLELGHVVHFGCVNGSWLQLLENFQLFHLGLKFPGVTTAFHIIINLR